MSRDPYKELSYSFRIVGLPEGQSTLVKKSFPQYAWDTGKYYLDESLAVLRFKLEQAADHAELIRFMHSRTVTPVSYGLFVALTSGSSDTGIEFPSYVLDFYRAMGGTIDISIVAGIHASWKDDQPDRPASGATGQR